MIISNSHNLNTHHGQFETGVFLFGDNHQKAAFLAKYPFSNRPLLRIQYGCLYGHVFHSTDCDCQLQTQAAMEKVNEQSGLIVYLSDHEAYGEGLFEKANIISQEKKSQKNQKTSIATLRENLKGELVLRYIYDFLKRNNIHKTTYRYLGSNELKRQVLVESGVRIESSEELTINENLLSDFGKFEVNLKRKI